VRRGASQSVALERIFRPVNVPQDPHIDVEKSARATLLISATLHFIHTSLSPSTTTCLLNDVYIRFEFQMSDIRSFFGKVSPGAPRLEEQGEE
jgi:hypothetical protein